MFSRVTKASATRSALSVVFCFALSASASASNSGARPNQKLWKEFTSLVDKDLSAVNEEIAKRVESLARKIIPGRTNPTSHHTNQFFVWHVWQVKPAGGNFEYIVLETPTIITIPGEAWERVYMFDSEGRLVGRSVFAAGWRLSPKAARILSAPDVDAPVLEISTEGSHDIARQYYALNGSEAVLVRLEKHDGSVTRNGYDSSNQTIGPRPPRRSPNQWTKALESSNSIEVLSALTWLGGAHSAPDDYEWGGYVWIGSVKLSRKETRREGTEDFKTVEALRKNEQVRSVLLGLSKSTNTWIREAAQLTLTKDNDDDG